jgi:predicted metalloprotease with PDZ domain
MRRLRIGLIVSAAVAALAFVQLPPSAIQYVVTIPEAEHHWLQVQADFTGLGSAPLKAFMSRSSPGRYAVHEFAKNVFWVDAYDGRGRKLTYTRPSPYEWDVAGHDGTVRLVYKVFGDLADGTYLAVDTTHAHMNMPAMFMFALGLETRPIRVTFAAPPGPSDWKVATQLYPTGDPQTFTAPNLQYFMDSPTEFSRYLMSTFTVPNAGGKSADFRIVAHTDAAQADVDELAKLAQRLVREHQAVYGEFPEYEPGSYTFLLDYWPWDSGDGMEHRNSTVITERNDAPLKTAQGRQGVLGTMSHEFFHNWNVERIRPAGLEPFDFTRANITCCLWLAEGFTQYYGPLLLMRAGFARAGLPANPAAVINGSGRQVRSAVQMSEYAPFSDEARSVDPTDQSRSFISYYTYGAAIALGLDLSLRQMSAGKMSLDDYMRLLWERHGKPGGPAPGLVGKPYSLTDLRNLLGELTNDRTFANDFFDKYVEGREVMDYAKLVQAAGFALKPASASDAGWTGVQVQAGPGGLTVGGGRFGGTLVPFGTPAYEAGIEDGDVIRSIDGQPASLEAWNRLRQKKPGDTVALVIAHRGDVQRTTTLTLKADPALQTVDLGESMTADQRAFRQAWLGTKVR